MRAAALDFKRAPATTTRPKRCTNTCAWKSATRSSRATLRSFCDRSVEMIEWLEAHGVEFDSTVPPCKTSYPADGYYLYFSGNETVKEYAGKYPPAPRGHRVKGAGLSGAMLFRALRKSVHAAGARVMTQSSVRRLVVDNKSGAVLGAELWQFEKDSAAARAPSTPQPMGRTNVLSGPRRLATCSAAARSQWNLPKLDPAWSARAPASSSAPADSSSIARWLRVTRRNICATSASAPQDATAAASASANQSAEIPRASSASRRGDSSIHRSHGRAA